MKKQNIFMIAMAALAMTACSSDEQTYDGPVAARISAGVSGPATKALNDVWEADEIGVTVVDAPNSEMEALYKNVMYVTEATTSAAANFTSDAPICFQDSEEEVTFSAYGPYQSELGADGSVAVNTAKQSTRAEQRPFDFIYASGAKASKANPTVEFKATIADVVYANNTAINPALKAGTSYTYTITVKRTGLEVSGCTIEAWNEGASGEGDAEIQ